MTDEDKQLLLKLRDQVTDLVATVADLALLDAMRNGTPSHKADGTPISVPEKQAELFNRLRRMLDRIGDPDAAG